MANRKMIQPLAPRKKNPPPPAAMAALGQDHELMELEIDIRQYLDGVLLKFKADTEFVLMTPNGARLLAGRLLEVAAQFTTV